MLSRHFAGGLLRAPVLRWGSGAVAAALTASLLGVAIASPATAASPAAGSNPVSDFGKAAPASTDLAVNAFGDGTGYHIQVAREKSGFTWQEVAVLRPGNLDDSSWTGYQCTSGDGRYEAVAVLPSSAVNTDAARDHGAFAYSVDLRTGKVRPIATGVGLEYFSPGCGTGDQAAFSLYLGTDEQTSEVVTADLATGKVLHTSTVAGQLTSPVPTTHGVVGVMGSELVTVPQTGAATVKPVRLAAAGGTPFNLRPSADGGVDFLTMSKSATTAEVAHEAGGKVRTLGSGPAAKTAIFQGRGGHNTVIGAKSLAKGSSLRSVDTSGLTDPAYTSLDGDAVFGDHQSGTAGDPTVLVTGSRKLVKRSAAAATVPVTGSASTTVPAGVPASAGSVAKGSAYKAAATAVKAGSAVNAAFVTPNAVQAAATLQTPKCSVPRNDPTKQAMQPSNSQVDWAVQMAEQNLLTGTALSRPANFDNLGLVSYAANSDFAEVPLSHPASSSQTTVPRSVMEAILAQESNWDQASWHALPGIAGNPLIGNYYGTAGSIDSINYAAADCGYGIGQVTNGMASTDTQFSAHGQIKIAVDYEENIAAGLQILERTWNQLYAAGITANGGDPKYLENWYFAIWAYNSGIQPTAAYGNTTSCTPGPTCAGPDGTWGLGWSNNPANPNYPPNRQPYLAYTYGDAAHPGNWPYQERVLGWMGTPLLRSAAKAYAAPTYNGGSNWLNIPSFTTFCGTNNHCTPNAANTAGTCGLADSECWWSLPATWIPNVATTGSTSGYAYGTGSTEPSSADPHPPTCNRDSSVLPSTSSGAPIIVSAQVGLATGSTPLNIVGCSGENWSNNGTFTMAYGTSAAGDPTGAIDTHQLGAGFGGYMMFTHTQNGSESAVMNTGTWTPNLPSTQYYKIKLHFPATGARATDVVYQINPGGSASPWKIRVNQDWESEQWVTIGTFAMAPGANVQLSNKSGMTPGGYDVGYDAIAFTPEGGTPGHPIGGPPGIKDAPKGSNPAFIACGCAQRTAGDPVDTATGYFGDEYTDLTTPGRGVPLSFQRSYASAVADPNGPNGALAVNGPFGYGWSYSYGLHTATDGTSGNVTVFQEDGSQVTFTDASGTYTPTAPRYTATLTKSGTTYTYTRSKKNIFTFDTATGRLLSESDLAGSQASPPYATNLTYNGSGQLSTVKDPGGRTYTLVWSGGHITSVTDSAGREVSYGYDASGNLTDVYGVGTTRTPSLKDDDHTVYTYQAGTHLITGVREPKYYGDTTTTPTPAMSMVYDSSERVTTQTDATGHSTTFTYGPDGGLAAGQTEVTDPSGNRTLDTYQDSLLVSSVQGYGSSSPSTTGYTYDPLTLAISTITDPWGNVETFAYDDNGNKISSSDGLGYTTNYTYDADNDLVSTIDAMGVITTNGYDQAGHIATGTGTNDGSLTYGLRTSTTVQSSDQSAEHIDGNVSTPTSHTVNYYYDSAAHPADHTRVVDGLGNTTTLGYDAVGDLASSTDAMGDKAQYGYNTATGQLTSAVSPDGSAAGTAVGCTPPAKGCTTYQYDAFGDLTKTTNALGHTTSVGYDSDGNKISSTDGNNRTTQYGYDAADRLTSTTAADAGVTKTDYNPNGTTADTVDAAGNKTTYTYDGQGRLAGRTDPAGHKTGYTYDPTGNVLTVTDPAGTVTTNTYDADSRLTSVSYSDSATPPVSSIGYDLDGRTTSMTDGTGTSTWTYDPFGDVTSKTSGSGATVGYTYDVNGNQLTLTYPGGQAGTAVQTFDKANRLTGVTDWNGKASTFGYDNDSNLTTTTYPNGDVVTNTFDGNDSLSAGAVAKSGTALASLTYTRDNAEQLASLTPSGLPGSAETYAYTATEQVKSVTTGSGTTGYGYDQAQNPSTSAGSSQAFNTADQLCWTLPKAASAANCASPPTGATTYTYNAQGDRTSAKPATGTSSTYTYNQQNQLTGFSGPGGAATYTYNGQGLRATKTTSAGTSTFTWDDGQVPSLLSDGTTSYLYGPDNAPIEQVGPTGTQWYFHDDVGSTRALLDSTGAVSAAYGYDAYGNVTAHTGTAATPLQFTGGYTDAESGLTYLRARYYDPATAQFLTVDPEVLATQTPYEYVDDNPLNEVDPSGNWGFLAALGAVAEIAAIPEELTALAIAVVVVAVVIVVAVVVYAVASAINDRINSWNDSPNVAQAKQSRRSDKAKANDVPSYARGQKAKAGETPEQAAERIFTEGTGRCPTKADKGPGGDVAKIKKGLTRGGR
ncbi:RHS repeat-associated core domain-containing protein [Streptacidiphilus cavernicola]|uniref:RHS repeat-associated core domain-containing protein n=1 Tax=Streptacidiphilus cavernicola TaxID=3342716 RepID=A0ABV6VNP6_9ACTN